MSFEHVVQPGDTLIGLSKRYGVPIYELIDLNQLGESLDLVPGTVLKIPATQNSAFQLYVIKPGDTVDAIAKQFQISRDDLLKLNGLDEDTYLYPNQRLIVPRPGVVVYITKPGDVLQNIADLYDLNPEDILVYNQRIYLLPDQVIAFRAQKETRD